MVGMEPDIRPEEVQSWEYDHWPKVHAVVSEGDYHMEVFGEASRWTPHYVCVGWQDDGGHSHWAWIPTDKVRRVSDSEWDIEQFHRCPENLRSIQWGKRLPGFLPG